MALDPEKVEALLPPLISRHICLLCTALKLEKASREKGAREWDWAQEEKAWYCRAAGFVVKAANAYWKARKGGDVFASQFFLRPIVDVTIHCVASAGGQRDKRGRFFERIYHKQVTHAATFCDLNAKWASGRNPKIAAGHRESQASYEKAKREVEERLGTEEVCWLGMKTLLAELKPGAFGAHYDLFYRLYCDVTHAGWFQMTGAASKTELSFADNLAVIGCLTEIGDMLVNAGWVDDSAVWKRLREKSRHLLLELIAESMRP